MGSKGPIPHRDADLARPRHRKGGDVVEVTKGQMQPITWPHADPDWHKIARDLYMSVKKSGQSDFYQQSDVALLYSVCDDLSDFKKASRRSAQMAQTVYSVLGSLLLTEGDRRRVRIELHEPEKDVAPASVLAIADYRADLGLDSTGD